MLHLIIMASGLIQQYTFLVFKNHTTKIICHLTLNLLTNIFLLGRL